MNFGLSQCILKEVVVIGSEGVGDALHRVVVVSAESL